jgi:hypothetical protein
VNERGLVAIAEIVYHGQKGREERENSRESAERQRREGARRASELQASREPQQRAPFCGVVALGWREGELQRERRKAKKRGREERDRAPRERPSVMCGGVGLEGGHAHARKSTVSPNGGYLH